MSLTLDQSRPEAPRQERIRHDLVMRNLNVAEKTYLTPNMIRIVLTGEELEGFTSPVADDNIKIFVPDETGATVKRSYTPRGYDAVNGRLVLDFAVHQAGPATRWALDVLPGDKAQIGGPRGSKLIIGDIERWLLIGDETALPAIARRLEDAKAEQKMVCIITVPGEADRQSFETSADAEIIWVHRDELGVSPTDHQSLIDTLSKLDLGEGDFVWLAAEGGVTRKLRAHLMEDRGLDAKWIKATGYWVAGSADTTAKFD